MAETVVSFALELVLQFLKEEGALLLGVHKEFAVIKDELESIESFIKDADRRAADEVNSNDGIKTWVKQLRKLCFRIEDVIDEYNMYVAHGTSQPGFHAFLQKTSHLIKTLVPRHKIASEIQDIRSSIREVNQRGKEYNFQPSCVHGSNTRGTRSGKWHDPRWASLFIEEAEVVGFEKPRDQVVGWLVNGATTRTVISLVGMGGLGKSTLAMNVFDSQQVKGYFECRAFITVSQTYAKDDLLRSILREMCKETNERLPRGINTMDYTSLVTEMRRYLQEKRYVIVFDDVWNVGFWDEIQFATPNNDLGSRIMITTRNLDVANCCKKSAPVLVHKLQSLPHNKAWELFCKKAFHFDFNGNCPSELEDMSDEMVQKCEGLPLAIVAIGGLLSTKEKNVFEWKNICHNLSSELERNPHLTSLTRILALSFDDLPYYLKSCMLYFGMYPEDYSIRCIRLVRQWIAEGFVMNEGKKPLEEVAEQYLTELIHRSLVQVSNVKYDGKALNCQVHDLLHGVIIKKMKDLSFCCVVNEDSQPTIDATTRRLAIATSSGDVLSTIRPHSHIQSMHMFQAGRLLEDFLKKFLGKSKLLKVLDLEGASLTYIPNDLGNNFHLRYLSLRKTKVKEIPKSIGKLQNLETLDLKETLVHDLPSEINKLTKLRHLLVCYRDNSFSINGETGVQLKESIGNLTLLQTLYHVEADHGGLKLITELRKLKQLRKLGLKRFRKEYGKALCKSILDMKCLETLHIAAITEDEIIDLQFISSLPQLRQLHLFGCLEKLPKSFPALKCLTRLSFRYSKLNDDLLKSLKDLPNLLRLAVASDAFVGEVLHFEEGFQKLKTLILVQLNKLSSIVIDNGGLPSLERLTIMRLPQLKEMPSSFHQLTNLESLFLTDMPHEFNQSIDPSNGAKYWVIQHVQLVSIREKVGPNRHKQHIIRHPKDI